MVLAKYANGPLKLYAGYEQIRYAAPSDPQFAFTDTREPFFARAVTRSTTRILTMQPSV
jgi:hypothetical protein